MPTAFIALLVYPVMALQFAVTKIGVAAGLTAVDIGGLRYLGALLLGFPLFLRADVRSMMRHRFGPFLAVGLLGGGFYGMVFATAIALTPASHGAVIVPSLSITVAMVGTGLLTGAWPDRARWVGLALIIGGLLVFAAGSKTGSSGFSALGDALLIVIGLMWGSASLAMKYWQVPPAAVAASFTLTGIGAVGYWLGMEGMAAAIAAPGASLLQMVFQGGLLTVLAFALWGELVRRIGPTRTALGVASVPPLALVTAVPLLGEWPTTLQYLGTGVVVAGIALASGAAQRRSER